MPALCNDPDRCEVLNLAYLPGGHGPYLVRQEGHPPGGTNPKPEHFILQKDGRWLLNLAFALLPEAEQEKQLFSSLTEVVLFFEQLCVKPVAADAALPHGVTAESVMAGFETCANHILRGMRTGSAEPVPKSA